MFLPLTFLVDVSNKQRTKVLLEDVSILTFVCLIYFSVCAQLFFFLHLRVHCCWATELQIERNAQRHLTMKGKRQRFFSSTLLKFVFLACWIETHSIWSNVSSILLFFSRWTCEHLPPTCRDTIYTFLITFCGVTNGLNLILVVPFGFLCYCYVIDTWL